MSRAFARVVFLSALTLLAAALCVLPSAAAGTITVKTVPWVASNPLIPHDTWTGKQITLKGTSAVSGVHYTWDFGDGTPVASGTVVNAYVVEATHAYSGAAGTIFTARLTVTDLSTGDTGSKEYYVALRDKILEVETNVAIDEGLWYLHKKMTRYTCSGGSGLPCGDWSTLSGFGGVIAANVNAFEVNGHLEDSAATNPFSPDDPYTETVARGMHRLLQYLNPIGIGPQLGGNPDFNGNGIGLYTPPYPGYQTGMFIDAIVASGTPTAIAPTGVTNVIGRSYLDLVQDLVDFYAWAEYDDSTKGGWRYNYNEWPDNSVAQWAAIGLIAAERNWGAAKLGPGGIVVPQWVKDFNVGWLEYSQNANGRFGYTGSADFPWGPYATTPSGMVQMVMDGLGRANTPPPGHTQPSWALSETFLRNNWCNTGGGTTAIKGYFYGLFSFTKSMLLHDPPITMLHSTTPGVPDIDWYARDVGDLCDGVGRNIVSRQLSDGRWWNNDLDGNQYPFETAWAVIMLNRTLFEAGAPVAVAKATPNPALAGTSIKLDGSFSFHQDPNKHIVSWGWDTNNDGLTELNGPMVTTSFATMNTYPVTLRVTDDSVPSKTASTTINVLVTIPPTAPTANAGNSYTFCPGPAKWFLDGSASVNPDQGMSEPGAPPDFIKEYAWDLNGDQNYNDRFGVNPDVTGFWPAGSYLIGLRVTDNTALSFPSSGTPAHDLTGFDSAQVTVKPACDCVNDLKAYAKSRQVQLTWKDPFLGLPNAADHYNIYRSTVAGGPYSQVGTTTSTYSIYVDSPVTNGLTYYYVVRQAMANGWEYCQSNEVQANPRALFPR